MVWVVCLPLGVSLPTDSVEPATNSFPSGSFHVMDCLVDIVLIEDETDELTILEDVVLSVGFLVQVATFENAASHSGADFFFDCVGSELSSDLHCFDSFHTINIT